MQTVCVLENITNDLIIGTCMHKHMQYLLTTTTYFLLPIRHTITPCCKGTRLHADIDGACWVWSVQWSHTTCHDIHWHWHITLPTECDTPISVLTPYVNTIHHTKMAWMYLCWNIDATVEFGIAVGADDLVAWRELIAVLRVTGVDVWSEPAFLLLSPITIVTWCTSGVRWAFYQRTNRPIVEDRWYITYMGS